MSIVYTSPAQTYNLATIDSGINLGTDFSHLYANDAELQDQIDSLVIDTPGGLLTTPGDIIVRGSSAPSRLGVGADGTALTVDSTATEKIAWRVPLPRGYLQPDWTITATTAQIAAGSLLSISGRSIATGSASNTLSISGAAGWRYITTEVGTTIYSEAIPVSEILADTERYSPTPDYSGAANGYYSSANPTRRIIAACYWTGSAIKHFYGYSHGKIKNDSLIEVRGFQSRVSPDAVRFGATPIYQHGTGLLWSDDGTNATMITVGALGDVSAIFNGYGAGAGSGAISLNGTLTYSGTALTNIARGNVGSGSNDQSISALTPVFPGNNIRMLSNQNLTNTNEIVFRVRMIER